ncbi:hypothetical protein MP228_003048 [Amoeboaphelidium protococcarum]|nr:hypothetical protein MP228_003048 [Amoeboaphelidium protococcarum]
MKHIVDKEIKYISARAIKRAISNAGVTSISAQTVQALNAFVDELLYNLISASYVQNPSVDNFYLPWDEVEQQIRLQFAGLENAVQEGIKNAEEEARIVNSRGGDTQLWNNVIFGDMASDRDGSVSPAGDTQSANKFRRLLVPYYRVYSKMHTYCCLQTNSQRSEDDFAVRRLPDDPQFEPKCAVMVTAAYECLVAICIHSLCKHVLQHERDVIKMEDMLEALSENVQVSKTFNQSTLKRRIQRKVDQFHAKQEEAAAVSAKNLSSGKRDSKMSTRSSTVQSPPMRPGKAHESVKKLELLLDNLQQDEQQERQSTQPGQKFIVRNEISPRMLASRGESMKSGSQTPSEVAEQGNQTRALIEFLSTTSPEGLIGGNNKQKSHSAVDLADVSTPETQRNKVTSFIHFLQAEKVKGSGNSKKLVPRDTEDDKKFRQALISFLQSGPDVKQPRLFPTKSSKLIGDSSNKSLNRSMNKSPVLSAEVMDASRIDSSSPLSQQDDVQVISDQNLAQDDSAAAKQLLKPQARKLQSRSAVVKTRQDDDSSDEDEDADLKELLGQKTKKKKKQKESLADFLRESGPAQIATSSTAAESIQLKEKSQDNDASALIVTRSSTEPIDSKQQQKQPVNVPKLQPVIESRRDRQKLEVSDDSDLDDLISDVKKNRQKKKSQTNDLLDFLNSEPPPSQQSAVSKVKNSDKKRTFSFGASLDRASAKLKSQSSNSSKKNPDNHRGLSGGSGKKTKEDTLKPSKSQQDSLSVTGKTQINTSKSHDGLLTVAGGEPNDKSQAVVINPILSDGQIDKLSEMGHAKSDGSVQSSQDVKHPSHVRQSMPKSQTSSNFKSEKRRASYTVVQSGTNIAHSQSSAVKNTVVVTAPSDSSSLASAGNPQDPNAVIVWNSLAQRSVADSIDTPVTLSRLQQSPPFFKQSTLTVESDMAASSLLFKSPAKNKDVSSVMTLVGSPSVVQKLRTFADVSVQTDSSLMQQNVSSSLASTQHDSTVTMSDSNKNPEVTAITQELSETKLKLQEVQKKFDELSERAYKQIQELIDERDVLKLVMQMLDVDGVEETMQRIRHPSRMAMSDSSVALENSSGNYQHQKGDDTNTGKGDDVPRIFVGGVMAQKNATEQDNSQRDIVQSSVGAPKLASEKQSGAQI